MKFSKKILETFVALPKDIEDLMEDVGLEIKSTDGDILNLELLANRGDHYCYTGLAREIAGRTGDKVKSHDSIELAASDITNADDLFKIETEKCLAYSLTPFNLVQAPKSRQTSDDYILRMLPASGVNVILDVIDITNVVMLELGQPAHVYDADKIVGKIHIRESRAGEKAALLFHEGMTELPAGTVVIADDEKIICVAGVIGCHAAEVDENTTSILLETALFDPVSIRKASRKIGHTSIASQIFERGSNYDAIKLGVQRAKSLYEKLGWNQSGKFHVAGGFENKKAIALDYDNLRRELEIKISDQEIETRLSRYGFIKSGDKYTVPNWRIWDIKGESADLVEEIARSVGYNAIPNRLPVAVIGAEPTVAEIRREQIDSFLVHNGFFEVFTDNMYSPKHAKASPEKEHIALENSVDGGYSFMKNNVIVQAAELIAKNLRVKNNEIRAYEWGKIFKGTREFDILWGVMNGAEIDALDAKGLMENLFADLSLDYNIEYGDFADSKKVSEWALLHPNRRGRISVGGRGICVFGEIHPTLLAEFDIKNNAPVFFSFDTAGLMDATPRKTKYISPSAIIPSVRDISVAVPYGVAAGKVAQFITQKYPAVAIAEITDVFDKPKEGLRNITITLTFVGDHSADSLNEMILEIMNSASEFAKK